MKRISFIVLLAFASLLVGCEKPEDKDRLMTMDDSVVHRDTARYARLILSTRSYFDYDIYGVYLLPAEKNSLSDAMAAPSLAPSQDPDKWGAAESGNSFFWDRNWATPKRFKVWWFRVVNPELFHSEKNNRYDPYTTKETWPGAAWCEAVITVDKPPPIQPGHFILHFYPDGHVESYISALKEEDAERMRFTTADREKLPVLNGKPCLKEIANPFFGMKKPILQN
jgi:hypothetical protein